ncbi:Septum-promoting GTP-binding protein 1 [Penicillium capsulatum]|uniref:Septum-promoting GTP-binding protein 1 n=1 Tax=Penicillium capsulatum TaxID=69766 RepID=A0A9W9IWL4_9EURO|nr:Septum-promoting GTP-binding protein 1 [Penicillium capsulatum]
MDPLQQSVLEASAVAEPLQQEPSKDPLASEVTPSSVPSEQPLEHPIEQPIEPVPEPSAQPIDQPIQQSVPVSVNVQAPTMDQTAPRAGVDNGYNSDSKAHYHSRSTDFHHSAPEYTPQDADASARLTSSPSLNQQPQLHTASRPGSGFSSGPERHNLSQPQPSDPTQRQANQSKNSVVIKVGMVGDAQIGKTSLMVKYVEGSWDEDYIQTLGVNFMEKTISIRNTEITFSIWDLGGQREFVNMLPLVCNDAVAILFMFDLTRKSTLNSIKEWYRQGRGFNKTAIPFLIGTKYDHFVNFPREDQEEISLQAKRFAKAMKASLIFSSTSHSINVQKIFKIVLAKAFDLKCTIPEIENVGEPLLLYKSV